MGENVTKLITTKPDAELAAEFKQRVIKEYEPLLALFDEINVAGFECQFQVGKGGPLGKQMILSMNITKVY